MTATPITYETVEDLAFLHCQYNMNERAYAAKLIPQPVYGFAKSELRKSIEHLSALCYKVQ